MSTYVLVHQALVEDELVSPADIRPSASLAALGVDAAATAGLVQRLADGFGATVPDGATDQVRTVDDVVVIAHALRQGRTADRPAPLPWSPSEIQVQRPSRR